MCTTPRFRRISAVVGNERHFVKSVNLRPNQHERMWRGIGSTFATGLYIAYGITEMQPAPPAPEPGACYLMAGAIVIILGMHKTRGRRKGAPAGFVQFCSYSFNGRRP